MPLLERVRTDQVVAGLFYHEPGEPVTSVEWWHEPCVAFTAFGSWEVRARRGKGEVTAGSVLVSEGRAEHDCRHPDGVGDRMLCVLYQGDVDTGPVLVAPQAVTVAALAAMGICTAPMTAWAQSLRMRLAPAQAHGRLFALLRTAMQATPPAGAALAALTLTHGTLAVVATVAAVMGLPALVLARDLMTAATDTDHGGDPKPAAPSSPAQPEHTAPAAPQRPSGA